MKFRDHQSSRHLLSWPFVIAACALIVACAERNGRAHEETEPTEDAGPASVSQPVTPEHLAEAPLDEPRSESGEGTAPAESDTAAEPASAPAEEPDTYAEEGPRPTGGDVEASPVTEEGPEALASESGAAAAPTGPEMAEPVKEGGEPEANPMEDSGEAAAAPGEVVETKPTPEPSLNLDELEKRLRSTKAIGLFTKLEIKNQVEDLVDDFEAFHGQRSKLTLNQLEERFDLLVMKLMALLQDEDPRLHHDIVQARPVLWTTLSSSERFQSLRGP